MNQAKTWVADAPSNIALIKYMGKIESAGNRPTNTSLSYTLPHLKSFVQLQFDPSFTRDTWEPLLSLGGKTYPAFEISEKGAARFLAHLDFIKNKLGFTGFFKVRSLNDFPSDCGLASSASSFAALTKVAVNAMTELNGKQRPTFSEVADFSRQGSGSSCRSFFAPWSVWAPDFVEDVPRLNEFGHLLHQVVVVNDQVKQVSSSSAHRRVASSLLFQGRPERADLRVGAFIAALSANQWREAFEIAWAEFWDMHALFETSRPSFGYMTSGSLEVLNFVRNEIWGALGDGPLVTMDAGPNIHLLYRRDAAGKQFAAGVAAKFSGRFQVIGNLDGAR